MIKEYKRIMKKYQNCGLVY